MFLSLPPHPEPQMTYLQDAVWSQFQAQARAASTPPWVLPGWARPGWGGRMQTAGSQVDWSQKVLSPPHPHAHSRVCAHTGMSACVEVFTLVQRCGSECLCQMHRRLCAHAYHQSVFRYRHGSSGANPSPSPPACGAGGAGLARGCPAPPSLGQCQLDRSIEDPTVATSGHPKGCQWVSVPFALRGGADKQGATSSSQMPQKQRDYNSSKALGCSETPAESGWAIPGERGSAHLWLSSHKVA